MDFIQLDSVSVAVSCTKTLKKTEDVIIGMINYEYLLFDSYLEGNVSHVLFRLGIFLFF